MRHALGFDYEGPVELLDAVERALRWVIDPQTGRGVIDEGHVRRVGITEGRAEVDLSLVPGPVAQVIREDLESELFDHLRGQCSVEVRLARHRRLSLAWVHPAHG